MLELNLLVTNDVYEIIDRNKDDVFTITASSKCDTTLCVTENDLLDIRISILEGIPRGIITYYLTKILDGTDSKIKNNDSYINANPANITVVMNTHDKKCTQTGG